MLELIVGIVGGISAIGVAIVTYINPKHAVKINAAIPVAATAVIEIATIMLA